MNIAPFGEVNPDELEECYEGELDVGGRTIAIDLNFEEEAIDEAELIRIKDYVSRLEVEAKKAIVYPGKLVRPFPGPGGTIGMK